MHAGGSKLSLLTWLLTWRRLAQDVRAGTAVTQRFHVTMQGLVDGMRQQRPEESSIAAHLLDIKDPETGELMPPGIISECGPQDWRAHASKDDL